MEPLRQRLIPNTGLSWGQFLLVGASFLQDVCCLPLWNAKWEVGTRHSPPERFSLCLWPPLLVRPISQGFLVMFLMLSCDGQDGIRVSSFPRRGSHHRWGAQTGAPGSSGRPCAGSSLSAGRPGPRCPAVCLWANEPIPPSTTESLAAVLSCPQVPTGPSPLGQKGKEHRFQEASFGP